MAVEEFDWCVIDLAVEEDKPELEKEDNGRHVHPHGSQSLKERNGEDDVEDGDKREFRERDNVNDLQLVPEQCEKNRPPNDFCSISIKQIFSTLKGRLDFSKDCTAHLQKNESVDCNLGLSEEVRRKVGSLIFLPNFVEASSSNPPPNLFHTNVDNPGTFSPISNTCVYSTFISPNCLIETYSERKLP